MPVIGFLHTSPTHVPTFEALVAELAPDVAVRSVVDEALLDRARVHGGRDRDVLAGVERGLRDLNDGGASTIVCTCSTVGGVAERVGVRLGVTVARVDRAMAERALAIGGRISVVAALASTIEPTVALLAGIADPTPVEVEVTVVAEAWQRFEDGDVDGYLASIAEVLPGLAERADVIVLAQASMAPAAGLVDLTVPILSSPRPGVQAALAAIIP